MKLGNGDEGPAIGKEELLRHFRERDSDELVMVVGKEPEAGRSFSIDAMEEVTEMLAIFVGARVLAAWDRRNEPPTRLSVRVRVEAS